VLWPRQLLFPFGDMSTRVRSVAWDDSESCMVLIDQRILPAVFELVQVRTVERTSAVIKDMTVRGAPAIGAAGGFGMAIAANASKAVTPCVML
jgi:methylthioribose-1-phosphate isomerase